MVGFIPVGNETPCRSTPWVNRTLIAINVLAFLVLALGPDYERIILTWGFRASDPTLITLVTAAFLHGGWLHLLGNMLYLGVLGGSVEDRLGHLGYLIFYLFGMVLAAVVHTFSVSANLMAVPCVGASGAVAAILGAYLLLYPSQKIKHWGWFVIRPVSFRLPAWLTLGWWFGLQAWEQLGSSGDSMVAYGAHIGGFITGFAVVGLLAISNVVTPAWASREAAPTRPPQTEVAPRIPCPSCEGMMEGLGSSLQRCLVCAGVWCPKGALESLIKARQLPPLLALRAQTEDVVENLSACPGCGQSLVPIEVRNVSVKACANCEGTFVPNGALERIRA